VLNDLDGIRRLGVQRREQLFDVFRGARQFSRDGWRDGSRQLAEPWGRG